MKREDFIKVIKIRSNWKIDKRKGNYQLPNGTYLKDYIRRIVEQQLEVDHLVITQDGNLCSGQFGTWNPEEKRFTDFIAIVPFGENEACSYDEQEKRISNIVNEIIM